MLMKPPSFNSLALFTLHTTRRRHVLVWKRARSSPIFGLPRVSLFYCHSIKVFSQFILVIIPCLSSPQELLRVRGSELGVGRCTGDDGKREIVNLSPEPWEAFLCCPHVDWFFRSWGEGITEVHRECQEGEREKRGSCPFHLPIVLVRFYFPIPIHFLLTPYLHV